MHKALAVGATLVAIVLAPVVSAQEQAGQGASGPGAASTTMPQTRMSDRRLADGLAFLKATLRLSPEQEQLWSAFEGALHALANVYRERVAMAQVPNPTADPTQRLRQRAGVLSRTSEALSRVADAQEPLYRSLDEVQKRRFAEFSAVSRARSIALDFDDDHDRRVTRDVDVERRRTWRDQESDRPRRFGRDDDGDRDWRDRDYRREGWRDFDRRYRDYDRGPFYGRPFDRDSGRPFDRDSGPRDGAWRDRDQRQDYFRPRWHDRYYDRRDRGYDRSRLDDEDDSRP